MKVDLPQPESAAIPTITGSTMETDAEREATAERESALFGEKAMAPIATESIWTRVKSAAGGNERAISVSVGQSTGSG